MVTHASVMWSIRRIVLAEAPFDFLAALADSRQDIPPSGAWILRSNPYPGVIQVYKAGHLTTLVESKPADDRRSI